MKAAKVAVNGTEYHLVYDGEAMFWTRDKYGSAKLLLEKIQPDTREAFETACAAGAYLAERGELIRRRLGYTPQEIPQADDFLLLVRPLEIVDLKNAVITAVSLGYNREVKAAGGDEVDEGLEELNQKKTHSAGRNITG